MRSDLALHGGGHRLVLDPEDDKPKPQGHTARLYGPRERLLNEIRFERTSDDAGARLKIPNRSLAKIDDALRLKASKVADDEDRACDQPVRIYTRLTDESDESLPAMLRDLQVLGEAMLQGDLAFESSAPEMAHTPVAYTYLGQFLAHELTLIRLTTKSDCRLYRDATLDLETIYELPHGSKHTAKDFGDGRLSDVWLGRTKNDARLDLPRAEGTFAPLIYDPRNDQNLAIAQMHVAITRFAWEATRRLKQSGLQSHDAIRRIVLRHFQSVVLHDYLPRLVDLATYREVMTQGRAVVAAGQDLSQEADCTPFFVPVEFAAAAFRFGHSMVRHGYQPWNTVDPDHGQGSASISGLVYFTGERLAAEGGLADKWTADWNHLLGDPADPRSMHIRASRIDAILTAEVMRREKRLFETEDGLDADGNINLATRTLSTGAILGLPSGQELVEKINLRLQTPARRQIEELTAVQLVCMRRAEAQPRPEMEKFLHRTPLWLYVLCEAAVQGGGQRLGQLGSRLVVETLHAAVEASRSGMIEDGKLTRFKPHRDFRARHSDRFDLVDLIGMSTHMTTP